MNISEAFNDIRDENSRLRALIAELLATLQMVAYADGRGAAIPIAFVHRAIAQAEAADIKAEG